MFKYIISATDTYGSSRAERLVNFFHVREIGPMVDPGTSHPTYFEIKFADGTSMYGLGADQREDVCAFALALR